MPWQALPVIGAGPGAAAAAQDQQQQQLQQQSFLAQLLMHAQEMQQQREATQAYREAVLGGQAESRGIRQQQANTARMGEQEKAVGQLPGGTDVTTDPSQAFGQAALGRFQQLKTLPSTNEGGFMSLGNGGHGGGTAGETQAQTSAPPSSFIAPQQSPSQPEPLWRKLPNAQEQEFAEREKDRALARDALQAQRETQNALAARKVSDTEGGTLPMWTKIGDSEDRTRQELDLMRQRMDLAEQKANQGRPMTFQESDMLSNMGSAEIQSVKVLRALQQGGLDQSNNPMDPRWNTFVAQTLKVRPQDESKADAIQRTAYVKAVLAKAIMGGRPNQYVMQMIEQHLPDSKMSGKQLAGVIKDVLDEVDSKRQNYALYSGRDVPPPTGGETWQQFKATAPPASTNRRVYYDAQGNQISR